MTNFAEPIPLRTARWLAFAASALIVVGIAPSQIALGLGLLALFISREKLRLPPIQWPLGLFLLGTLVAVALSSNPVGGFPQVKKIYVFTQLLLVYTLLRDLGLVRWLFLTWASLGGVSAAVGFGQFLYKLHRAHQLGRDFYAFYVERRITGFMSHWYTFSVEEMFILIMLGSFLFFGPKPRRYSWIWPTLGVIMSFAVLLGETRGVWIALAVSAVYLVWFRRRWLVALIPVAILLALFLSPPALRDRITSVFRPGRDDSNQFRVILARTGVRMVKAHPWFGLGPEMPRVHFLEYLPPDVPRPLPAGSYMHLHNLYLEYAAERGIPTLLMLLWLLGKIVWDFGRGLRNLPPGRSDQRFLLHGGIAVVIAVLIEGFTDVNLGDSEVLTMFLVVVACGYVALDTLRAPEPAS